MAMKFDPETLEIIKAKSEQNQEGGLYLLVEHGIWNGSPSLQADVFLEFTDALKVFERRVKDCKAYFKEWCDIDQIEDDLTLNKDAEQAHYESYQRGNSDRLYDEIYIRKVKVNRNDK